MRPLTPQELQAHRLLPHQVNHARKVLRRMWLKAANFPESYYLGDYNGVVGFLLACRIKLPQAQKLAHSYLGLSLPHGLDPLNWGQKDKGKKGRNERKKLDRPA